MLLIPVLIPLLHAISGKSPTDPEFRSHTGQPLHSATCWSYHGDCMWQLPSAFLCPCSNIHLCWWGCLPALSAYFLTFLFHILSHGLTRDVSFYGCLKSLLVIVHTEDAPSSRQEACDLGTIPRCGDSNWQLNTHSDSFKIACYTWTRGKRPGQLLEM